MSETSTVSTGAGTRPSRARSRVAAGDRERDRTTTAIVVGASLSGLMTALTLAREGVDVTVLERSGDPERTGAQIGIPDGLLAQLTGRPSRPGRNALRGLAHTWHEAHAALQDEARADPRIELHPGVAVTHVGQDDDSAWAIGRTGERFGADLLIGADGYRSVVRRHVAPDDPDATFADYVLWYGMGGEDVPTERPWPSGTTFTGDEQFPLVGTPLLVPDPTTGTTSWQLTWAWTDASRNDLLRELGCVAGSVVRRTLHGKDVPESAYEDLAADARAHFASPWREVILDCIDRRAIIGTPIKEYVPERLVRGRIALVGDAAHVMTPMIGQGFGESLQDAEAIASAVGSRSTGGASDGLLAYQRERLAAVRSTVLAGHDMSRAYVRRARRGRAALR